jgi:hypothetical protein
MEYLGIIVSPQHRCASLSQAVANDWYFQMYLDDLPVWGFVGKTEKIIANRDSKYK